MRELMRRNELAPERLRLLHPHLHRRPQRRVPRGGRAAARPRPGAAALHPRARRARGDGAGDPGARPLLRARPTTSRRTSTSARRRGCAPTYTRPNSRVAIHVRREAWRQIPGYVGRGARPARRPEAIADEGIAQLASNESPFGPAPGGDRGDRPGRGGHEPLPGPARAALLRRRIAERFEVEPVAGRASPTAPARSCSPPPWRSASPAPSSSTPGRRSRSTRTSRRSRAPARSASRSPTGDVHDLDAMLAEITVATQLVCRLQPEQPDRHPPAGSADRRVLRRRSPTTSP